MIFFNLQLLESKAKTDLELYQALYNLYINKKIKRFPLEKTLIIPNLHKGNSFIINPKDLFKNTTNVVYTCQYIKLAGRRSFLHYSAYGIKYLDLSYFPDINIEAIKFNYLLKITENKIHFKFEE